jgi:hypothetical protein
MDSTATDRRGTLPGRNPRSRGWSGQSRAIGYTGIVAERATAPDSQYSSESSRPIRLRKIQ